MIFPPLHRSPVAIDTQAHRRHAVRRAAPGSQDWSMATGLNAVFVAAGEFGDVCREYPLVFVRAGREDDGSDAIAPVAVLGMRAADNLFVEQGRWRARYVPALLRLYPFCLAPVDAERFAVCVDAGYAGFGEAADGAGDDGRLFDAAGQPTALMDEVRRQLEALEAETQRTRAACRRFQQLGLLREMRFDATGPDGRKHAVDGFLTLDERKATDLPAGTVHELHRTGLLAMMHQHWVSLGTMQRLAEWQFERAGAGTGTAATAAANDGAAAPSA